jgi:hypothetical protein
MKYCFINIPCDPINHRNLKNLIENKTAFIYNKNEYRFLGKNVEQAFTEDFVQWLDKQNCSIGAVEIWKVPANHNVFWHIDSFPPVDFAKLLLPWDSKSILIEWGECNAMSDVNRKLGVSDHPYLGFEDNEVTVIDNVVVDNPIIVNPSILHRALNHHDKDFYTLNLTLLDKETGMRLTSAEGASRLVSVV